MSAGRSEMSSLINDGMMGIENSINISTAESADMIAVTVTFRKLLTFVFINNTLSNKFSQSCQRTKNVPYKNCTGLNFSRIQIFSHPDCTVGFGISPNQLSLTGLWTHDPITVGGEFHPAPKTTVNLTIL